MIPEQLQLETSLVRLRPVKAEDFNAFQSITQDPDTWLFFSVNLADPKQLQEWMNLAFHETGMNIRRAFTIEDKGSGRIAGSSSMGNISYYDLRLEIGWSWLGTEFRKTQINRHAKFAMMRYAFEELNFERVEFKTDVLNKRARRGLEKIGGIEEGVLRSHMKMWNDRRRTSVFYSVLKNEWPELRSTIFADIA